MRKFRINVNGNFYDVEPEFVETPPLDVDDYINIIDYKTNKIIIDYAHTPDGMKQVLSSASKLTEGKTSFIIAHRLSTIQDSDVIVVIDKGEIVEQGNHKALLEKQGKYYDLYMTQFAGKEI